MVRLYIALGSLTALALYALIPCLVTAFVMKAEHWEREAARKPVTLKGRDNTQKPKHDHRR